MTSEDQQVVCKALTLSGQPCRVLAQPGSEYCAIHEARAVKSKEAPEPADRAKLAAEIDAMVKRLKAISPDYQAPAYSPRRLLDFVQDALHHVPKAAQSDALGRLKKLLRQDLLDPQFWKGSWYMLNYTVKFQGNLIKRRFTGEYETDEWGLDMEFIDSLRPILAFLYKLYWRVQASGLENVPVEGRALVVANRSGQLPWDSVMLTTAILTQHSSGRVLRALHSRSVAATPFLASFGVKLGQALDTVENGVRLLEQDQLVAVFPEGDEGAGKPLRRRYRLAGFGTGGFVKMALRTGAPLIPVAVVGAEETYLTLARLPAPNPESALPYFPITLTFPWLGLLGLIPLPTRWAIDFGPPIPTDGYGPDAATNNALISQLTDHARNRVQELLQSRLAQRRSVFRG